MAEMTGEHILIFKTADEDLGVFSNQYPAPFTYMGTRFETVEQFLYYMRAIFGRSKATADKILECGGDSSALLKTSKKQRILENNSWEAVRPQVMRIGMRQKFLQNPELRKKLLGTGFSLLVEMPKESLIGRLIPGNEEWVHDPAKWKGRNQTGKVLMQVRADLRCADRLVGADEEYVFPKEPFILQTPIGQMSLKEIAALPGARESVRTYAEIAQQYQELLLANADDFIGRHTISLAMMEHAIACNSADIESALNRAKTRVAAADTVGAEPAENAGSTGAEPAENAEFTGTEPVENAGFTDAEPAGAVESINAESVEEIGTDAGSAVEKLPDDIPREGFYELLFDLDELMKLGVI